jgi:hypothetical protein
MSKTEIENCAEAGDSPKDLSESELGLLLDHGIIHMLGLRCEIMDDFIKVWPREVEIPDETNFLIGARFTQNLAETRNVLDGMHATLEVREEEGGFVGVISADGKGELTTSPAATPELAGAFGVYGLLWAVRKNQSRVT